MYGSRGQVSFVVASIAVVVILLALAFTPVIKQFADDARNSTTSTQVGLDCSNSSISNFDKASCIAVDVFNPYFTGFLIFIAGAFLVAKIAGSGA